MCEYPYIYDSLRINFIDFFTGSIKYKLIRCNLYMARPVDQRGLTLNKLMSLVIIPRLFYSANIHIHTDANIHAYIYIYIYQFKYSSQNISQFFFCVGLRSREKYGHLIEAHKPILSVQSVGPCTCRFFLVRRAMQPCANIPTYFFTARHRSM